MLEGVLFPVVLIDEASQATYGCSISASPTACVLCEYGRAGTGRGGHFEYRHAHTRAMDMHDADVEPI